jgi:GGDEF domain-containing protein
MSVKWKQVSFLNLVGPMIKNVMVRFLHMSIAGKMLLGYLMLVALIVLISILSISGLEKLNKINGAIIRTDVPLTQIADLMIDAIISQELYSRRYAILKSPEMLNLSKEKSGEFDILAEKIRSLPGAGDVPVERIITLHSEYRNLFLNGMKHFGDPSSAMAKEYESAIKKNQEALIGLIKDMSSRAHQDQNEKTIMSSRIGAIMFRATLIFCVVSVFLSIGSTVLITGSIARPISRLKLATQHVSEGKFHIINDINNRDELGDLSNAFNEMTRMLRRLEEMYLDASPLTRLPGSIAMENVLKKRIESGNPLAFCYIDMDNFKAFNDKYGYARGNEVIVATSRIIEKSAAETGAPDDFVGHIGGDDFVLITTPGHFKKSCSDILRIFDETIQDFYDPEDLNRGFIIGKTRHGQDAKFPIMSISIAVVTNLEHKITTAIQVGEIAAELKEYAKSIPGSVYVIDRRRKDQPQMTDDKVIEFIPQACAQKTYESPN